MQREDRQDFRIPEAALRKQFLVYLMVIPAASLVIGLFVGGKQSLSSQLSGAGLLAALLVCAYWIAVRLVYVSTTPEAMRGRGPTWRRIVIRWTDPVAVEAVASAAMPGVHVRLSSVAGLVRPSLENLFIPDHILRQPSFRAAVKRHSPSGHPLRAFVDAGT